MSLFAITTGSPRTPSLTATLLLCWLLLGFAVIVLVPEVKQRFVTQAPGLDQVFDSAPYLMGWRNETGHMFIQDRIQRSPVLYGCLHVVPAILWCILFPMQLSEQIRRKNPALHRWSGRVALASNAVLVISGLSLAPRKLSFTHPNRWHLHGGVMPTFEVATTLLAFLQGTGIVQTFRFARKKQFGLHKSWANFTAIAGLAIAMQRVAMIAVMFVGGLLAMLPHKVQRRMAIPEDIATISAHEMAAFALTAWMSFVVQLIWFYRISREPQKIPSTPASKKLKSK